MRDTFFQKGFTLIEIIVAIGIFSLLSMGCYLTARGVISSRDRIIYNSDKIREFSRGFRIIDDDFKHIIVRGILDENGGLNPSYEKNPNDYENMAIEFSRTGYRNPLYLKRSKIIRVAYSVSDDLEEKQLISLGFSEEEAKKLKDGKHLIRYVWPVLDRGDDNEPVMQLILKNIESFDVEYFNDEKNWLPDWPLTTNEDDQNVIPSALKIKITDKDKRYFERIFTRNPIIEKK